MRFREVAAERTGQGMRVEPSSDAPARSLTGRTMSRRQALGLAGGALAGVAALASMPSAAGARVEGSSAVLGSRGGVPPPLPYYGQGTYGRLFPRLPAFASDSPEVRSALLELGKRGGIMDAGDQPPPASPLTSNPNKRIDAKLSSPLFELPFGPPNDPQTLAQRNLLRHVTFGLPSGQRVAKAMKIEPLGREDLSDLQPMGFDAETPLWFYVLKEAELEAEGKTLGPVGGRIVAEVFVGLLQGDPNSYLQKDPSWKPTLGQGQDFEVADLLRFAGVA
jgi:hypothetical protein